MTNKIFEGWLYPPKPLLYAGKDKARQIVMVDPQKQNLVWLAGIDDLNGSSLIIDDVHEFMSTDVRNKLRELPKAFMLWLQGTDSYRWRIMRNMPNDYLRVMRGRAEEAQNRLLKPVESNVVLVDFSKRRIA